jgi:hypothetical protein
LVINRVIHLLIFKWQNLHLSQPGTQHFCLARIGITGVCILQTRGRASC